ncbi:MAG: TetR/AcrR family transcriptional regulator [Acidimicrobiales bacterium]
MEDISTSRRAPFGSNPTVGDTGRATQQRILAAAGQAFAEHGYARTSVEAITDIAGCSRPTFYQYFSGKEDLHRRLATRFGADLADLLNHITAITADRAGRDELRRWLDGLADVHDRYRAVADNFAASVRTDDLMVTGSRTLSEAFRRRLLAVIEDVPTRSEPIELCTTAVNSIAYGSAVFRTRLGGPSKARLTDAAADATHRMIYGAIDDVNVGPRVPGRSRRHPAPRPTVIDDGADRPTRGQATRARLVDAAATAFGTLGYEAVRVDDIATEADVSHGTFYRYFTDKDDVFTEHVDATTDEVVALLDTWPVAAGDEVRWATAYYELFARRGGIIACLPEAQTAGLECAARSRHETAQALRRALDTREFGDTEADVVICFALLENLPSVVFRALGLSVDDAITATALVIRRGIFGAD